MGKKIKVAATNTRRLPQQHFRQHKLKLIKKDIMALGEKSPLQTWDDPQKPLGKTYRIPCSWEMYGVMEVKAESLEEAVRKAFEGNTPLPMDNSSYVEASFDVDVEVAEEYNPENCL
tara:strand:+ start:728 stop:1078 length:351 start_codon:yes stop_codon:yes gene_type:complete